MSLRATNIGAKDLSLQMSSKEDPTRRKTTTNETGRKTMEFEPRDLEQIRRNVRSNDREREEKEDGSSLASSD